MSGADQPLSGMPLESTTFEQYKSVSNSATDKEFDREFEQWVRVKQSSRNWKAWKIAFTTSTILLVVSQIMVLIMTTVIEGTVIPGYEFFNATHWGAFNGTTIAVFAAQDAAKKIL